MCIRDRVDANRCRTFCEVIVVNWSALPDLAAVGLLTGAFASVAKRNQTDNSNSWLIAWLMIALHFAASLFQNLPGAVGSWAQLISMVALGWSGILFLWASVPYRRMQNSLSLIHISIRCLIHRALLAAPGSSHGLPRPRLGYALTRLLGRPLLLSSLDRTPWIQRLLLVDRP